MTTIENNECIIVSLEGNIGSGKSTLLEKLKEKYSFDPTICFIQEPVDQWNSVKDKNGSSILELYYADQEKYAFTFQMLAYVSRLSVMRAALKKNYRVIIIERSVYTDSAVFAKMLYDNNKIGEVEYIIYMKWFQEFIEDFPQVKFVYIRTDPEISFERVIRRGRLGETIPLEYLQNCHKYHENWLLNLDNTKPMLMLDANCDINTDTDALNTWLNKINEFIS